LSTLGNKLSLIKKVLIGAVLILIVIVVFLSNYISKQEEQNPITNVIKRISGRDPKQEAREKYNSQIIQKQLNETTDQELKEEVLQSQIYSVSAIRLQPQQSEKFKEVIYTELNTKEENIDSPETGYISEKKIYINTFLDEIAVNDTKTLDDIFDKKEKDLYNNLNILHLSQNPKELLDSRAIIVQNQKEKHVISPIPIDQNERFEQFLKKLFPNPNELSLNIQSLIPSPADQDNILPNLNNLSSPEAFITTTPLQQPSQEQDKNITSRKIDIPSSNMDELLKYVSGKVGVPFGVLKGVLMIEGPQYLDLQSKEIDEFSQDNYVIPGCGPNVCSATGPMQITIGLDNNGLRSCPKCCWGKSCLDTKGGCPNQWAVYGNTILKYENTQRTPKPCNLLDNLYAAAAKLKKDSRTGAKNTNWSREEIFRAAVRYYGNCTVKYKRLEDMTYCEYVYSVYKNIGF